MIKRRKTVRRETADDLADVNEQELAKDIEINERSLDVDDDNQAHDMVNPQVEIKEPTKTQAVEKAQTADASDVVPVGEIHDGAQAKETKVGIDGFEKIEVSNPKRRRRGTRGAFYVAVMIFCLLTAVALVVGTLLLDKEEPQATVLDGTTQEEQSAPLTEAPQTSGERLGAEEIYERGVKSTVTVAATANGSVEYFSGFAVFGRGYVATLCEAIDGKSSVEIVTYEGQAFPATVVGADRSVNLALLKTDALTLDGVSVGRTDTLGVGNSVFAIGNVGGGRYASSLLATQVAYCERSPLIECCDGVTRRVTAIQLGALDDEALKGCPIFNCYGEAVAITLASVEDGAASLAIPLDKAITVLLQMKNGEVLNEDVLCSLAYKPPQLGIIGEQAQLGEVWGILITDFTDPDSDCASKLRIGDLIWKIGNAAVGDLDSLKRQMELNRAGDTVEVFVRRNSQALSFFVTVN